MKLPILVRIDAGHGGRDGGAIGVGINEKDLNLTSAQALQYFLKLQQVGSSLSRVSDTRPTYADRVATPNDEGLVVALHHDTGSADPGLWVFFNDVKAAKHVAKTLGDSLGQAVGASVKVLSHWEKKWYDKKGVVIGQGLYINDTAKPAVLVELGPTRVYTRAEMVARVESLVAPIVAFLAV
jgi:N-acetylmuramoyl-L-alanine amidase